MFEKIKRRIVGKNENSSVFQTAMAEKVNGRVIRYVTERINNDEIVIGKDGSLQCRNGILTVYAGSDVLFRGTVGETKLAELLSLDGVIITGCDLNKNGIERCIVAYYQYYR